MARGYRHGASAAGRQVDCRGCGGHRMPGAEAWTSAMDSRFCREHRGGGRGECGSHSGALAPDWCTGGAMGATQWNSLRGVAPRYALPAGAGSAAVVQTPVAGGL